MFEMNLPTQGPMVDKLENVGVYSNKFTMHQSLFFLNCWLIALLMMCKLLKLMKLQKDLKIILDKLEFLFVMIFERKFNSLQIIYQFERMKMSRHQNAP